MADRILIQGMPYEVLEWDQRDPDTDGQGTAEWTLYARRLEDEQPDQDGTADVNPDMLDQYQAGTVIDTPLRVSCPHDECRGRDLIPDSDASAITLGDLMTVAIDHEADKHGGYQPHPCTTVDLPGVGPTRVQGDLDEQGAAHVAEVVKAAQRKHTEDLKAQGRAELHEQLLALRAQWNTRRARREAHRETADGPTARLASIEHDIYARILRELDTVLNAMGEGR